MKSDKTNVSARIIAAKEADAGFPARSAVATFLFMVMPVDGQTHPKEVERLSRILSDDFTLSRSETNALVEHVKEQQITGSEMQALAEVLKTEFEKDVLLTLISHMWEMVFADGRMHETEVLLVEKVANLLDIDPDEVAAAMTA